MESKKEEINANQNLLIEMAMDAIITVDENEIFTFANAAVFTIFGYSKEELIGQKLEILFPDNKYMNHSQHIKDFGRSSSSKQFMRPGSIIKAKTKAGKLITIETSLSKSIINGRRFYNAIIKDVSLRVEAEKHLKINEEKFRGIFNSMIDVFVRYNFEGKILLASPSIFNITGYTAEEIINKNLSTYFVDKDISSKIFLEPAMGGGVQSFESKIKKKDGSIISITSNAKLFYDNDGNPVGIESVFRDITEKKLSDKKILKAQKKLKDLTHELTIAEEKMRRQLAIDLHDDVGQLLASSRMQMAAIDFNSDRKLIEKKIKSISKTILLATKSTRKVIFNLSPPQLNEIGLYAAIHDWMKQEIEKIYDIHTSITGDKKIYDLKEDARFLLFRSVRELLINAAKHAQASFIKIRLIDNHKSLVIVVKDDGIGLDFDPDQIKFSKKGFGLLSIQERISNLNGSMTFNSKPNFGTEIKLVVPIGL